MDFVEAFEGPIIEPIGGVDISFPPLLIDDYAPWAEELRVALQADAKKTIPRTMDATAQIAANQRIARIPAPGLDVIAELVWTIPGAKQVLSMSLAKAGVAADDAKKIIAHLRPNRLHALAADVSRLFERRAVAAAETSDKTTGEEGQSDPNLSSPADQSENAAGGTGSQTGA